MKNRFMRKVLIYGVSILVVCGVAGGIFAVRAMVERAEQKALEATYEAPKAAMTQEEMEALYTEHKKDRMGGKEEAAQVKEPEEEAAGDKEEEADREASGDLQGKIYEGCPVDFEGMWEINEDVYAWITIPGTVIDYPVLQHEMDNSYYLNYNIDGSYGYPGCIYTENMNSKDFTDNNTVIYGHNMKNGTMFSSLHKYEDAAFFKENDKIIIYTPQKELNYTIFAAYIYDDRHLLYSFDFADEAVYDTYLKDIQGMRSMNTNLREDLEVTKEDRIITLATCISSQPEKRLLVQAVLDSEGGKSEK